MTTGKEATTQPRTDGFVEVRDSSGHRLLFRYDPVRQLVEIRQRQATVLVDLTRYAVGKDNVKQG